MVSPAQRSMTSCRQQPNEQANIQITSSPYESALSLGRKDLLAWEKPKWPAGLMW
jgi:hypothetical protein